MSTNSDAKLVHMANQIARNLALDDNPVAAVADHIRAFWSPRMIEGLKVAGDTGLDPVAALALACIAARADAANG